MKFVSFINQKIMSKQIQISSQFDYKIEFSDPPKIKYASLYEFFSLKIWGSLPSQFQRLISKIYAKVFNLRISKHLIKPYCKIHYKEVNYLDQFTPPSGKTEYHTFQDFFVRQFKELPKVHTSHVWPCEGVLCDIDHVSKIQKTNVKGDIRSVHQIFGIDERLICKDYVFTNVFLHNKNYHRIHAPIDGTITRVQYIKGDLVILRPWFYKNNPSIPAFRNERINIDIKDNRDRTWHLSIVGGPAVGTIELPKKIILGAKVSILDEIALFYLGSTCCMISPEMPKQNIKNSLVYMGAEY
ncbi:hypothetical protein GCM10022259_28220 [Aquimarina mytili]